MSAPRQIDKRDFAHIAIDAAKVGAGASTVVICEWALKQDWGAWQILISGLIAGVLHVAHKYYGNTTPQRQDQWPTPGPVRPPGPNPFPGPVTDPLQPPGPWPPRPMGS